MATGKHPASGLGLSIALLLNAVASGTLLAQTADATFRIVENGTFIGASPGTIALPDEVFGAYQALAARVESLAPGSDIPLLLTPRGEVHGTVDAVRDEDLQTTTSPIRARRVSLIVMREVPTPIEIWVAKGMLLRVDLPLDHLSVIRDDLTR
jgi:hypothetical protein